MADPTTNLTVSEIEALSVARSMAEAGIPIFVAPPCVPGCGKPTHPPTAHHYKLPGAWQTTRPDPAVVDQWRPGYALAAIGGRVADFLDVDPRSGGDVTAEALRKAGLWPRVFGRQRTPSGGYHEIITPTGQRKGVLAKGVDLQAGEPGTGEGLGFVYLAPTTRPSKADGITRPYVWEETPDLEALAEWRGCDDSTGHVIHLMTQKRTAPVPTQRTPEPSGDDPFMTPGMIGSAERSFTTEQAKDYLRPYLERLRAAQIGEIEETANVTATALSHFVPAFWSSDQAYALLTDALSHTAYDPTRPGAMWTAEKFRPVLDGRRPPLDNWKATVRPDAPTAPVPVLESTPETQGLSVKERLRAMLRTAQEVADSPAPEPLVYGLLDLDTESWLIGAPGSLKSFIALDIAGHVGSGREWQGHRVRRSPVLYIAAEGARGMVLRTRAWMKAHGDMEGVTFLPYPVKVKSADGQWQALTELAAEGSEGTPYGLIVIDTQARVSTGLEENSATDMGILTEAVGALKRATGACVLVIHHTGRNGGDARGSSALDGAQDTELKVVRAEPRSSLMCKLLQDKQKDMGETDGGVVLRMKVVDLGTDPDTGRDLSSLVVRGQGDVFEDAQGQEIDETRPWLPEFDHRDVWRKKILNAFHDFTPEGIGLTKAEIRGFVGADTKSSSFADAWKAVIELKDPKGHPVVENIGGQRFAITSLPVLAAMKRADNPGAVVEVAASDDSATD